MERTLAFVFLGKAVKIEGASPLVDLCEMRLWSSFIPLQI